MVREARMEDIARMVDLGRAFFEETTLGEVLDYDEESAAGTFAGLIGSERGTVFLLEIDGVVVGGVAGMVAPHYFNLTHLTGQELFWYVAPEHRGQREAVRLVAALEEWARQQGCLSFVFAAMSTSSEAVARFYERRGYRQQETYYMGRL